MTRDDNKGISSINYNYLNLPVTIHFGQTKKIQYLYDAAGTKLRKIVVDNSSSHTTDYLDGFQYYDSVLDFFPTAEGYVKNTVTHGGNNYNYVYNYTDHLGNIRLSYGRDPELLGLKVLEENNYYPFGLEHHNYNMTFREYTGRDDDGGIKLDVPPDGGKNTYKYRFQSQEWQEELGLDWYSFKWRNEDPATGRFMSIDPLAEKSRRWSPYSYCFNNPLRFVDPDGMEADDIIVMSYGPKTEDNETHKSGHQAILVGDDKNGWRYYSLDGDTYHENANGDVTNNDFTEQKFASLDEFANSSSNTFKDDYDDGKGTETSEKNDDGSVKQRYKEAYRIETTAEQDKAMNAAARKVTEKGWNYLANNCTAVPQAALDAGGLKNGEWTPGKIIGEPPTPNFKPQAKQKAIEMKNKGKDVSDFLKRKK